MREWLQAACTRLRAGGFSIDENVGFEGAAYLAAARRSRFELTKFGFAEYFFLFSEFDRVDMVTVRKYGAAAFRYSLKHCKVFLPRGFFEAVFVFPVLLSPRIDAATREAIRTETPPKHWASAEIPVIYDTTNNELVYFEKTPFWGAAYWNGFRKLIRRFLVGSS